MIEMDPNKVVALVNRNKSYRIARLIYALPHPDEYYNLEFSDGKSIVLPIDTDEVDFYYRLDDEIGKEMDSLGNGKKGKGPESLKSRLLQIEDDLFVLGLKEEWKRLFPGEEYPLFNFQPDEQAA